MKQYLKKGSMLLLSFWIVCSFHSFMNAKNQEVYFDLNTTFHVQAIDEQMQTTPLPEEVTYGSLLSLQFSISNHTQAINTKIGYSIGEGVALLPYFYGVLTIDNHKVNEYEYQQFLSDEYSLQIGKTKKEIQLIVQSIGSSRGKKISSNLHFYSKDITYKSQKLNKTYAYSGVFLEKGTAEHKVRIFDNTTIIKEYTVAHNTVLNLEPLQKTGYYFEGYNLSNDGKATYYTHQQVQKDLDLYAIYHKNQYRVNYYVEEQLYATYLVSYASELPIANTPTILNGRFLSWEIKDSYVYQDIAIFANIQYTNPLQTHFSYKIKTIVDGMSTINNENKITAYLKEIEPKGTIQHILSTIRDRGIMDKLLLSLIPTLLALLIGFILYKKKERNI